MVNLIFCWRRIGSSEELSCCTLASRRSRITRSRVRSPISEKYFSQNFSFTTSLFEWQIQFCPRSKTYICQGRSSRVKLARQSRRKRKISSLSESTLVAPITSNTKWIEDLFPSKQITIWMPCICIGNISSKKTILKNVSLS